MHKKHDGHVKARNRLISRVLDRHVEWRSSSWSGWKGIPREDVRKAAARALASYSWSGHEWWVKRKGYTPFNGYKTVSVYADVPVSEVHSIMLRMEKPKLPPDVSMEETKRRVHENYEKVVRQENGGEIPVRKKDSDAEDSMP